MLVLASASPRRRALLSEHGYAHVVDPAGSAEVLPPDLSPRDGAVALAREKAGIVSGRRADGLPVLAADTLVVAASGEVLGKPVDAADARRMLRALSGSTQEVVTGVCLRTASAELSAVVVTRVTMRPLSDAEIDAYVVSGESFGKAGAYAIQETGDRFVERVDGSWSNVVGLPMERVAELLSDAGLHPERRPPRAVSR